MPAREYLSVALDTLSNICRDLDAPSAARVAAARSLLEYEQAIGPRAKVREPGRPDPASMSADDLAAAAAVPADQHDPAADPFS